MSPENKADFKTYYQAVKAFERLANMATQLMNTSQIHADTLRALSRQVRDSHAGARAFAFEQGIRLYFVNTKKVMDRVAQSANRNWPLGNVEDLKTLSRALREADAQLKESAHNKSWANEMGIPAPVRGLRARLENFLNARIVPAPGEAPSFGDDEDNSPGVLPAHR